MHLLTIGVLLGLLLIAAWQDVRHYRIPNALVFPGMALGVLLHAALPPEMGGIGVSDSLAGLAAGFALLLPLYLLRAMGAGDVKLMAMVGAFVGPGGMIGVLLCVLLAGGALALGVAWRRGQLRKLFANLRMMLFLSATRTLTGSLPVVEAVDESAGRMPYGVAIAAGTLAYLLFVRQG